jgi:hypothetical protein
VTVTYETTSVVVTRKQQILFPSQQKIANRDSDIPTTYYSTEILAPVTTSVETFVYETSTSICPITTVSTVSGSEVTVVYTSTSLIVKQLPTTIVYTLTVLTTLYETTDIYTTTTCFTTYYTTVSAGSTIVIRKSLL